MNDLLYSGPLLTYVAGQGFCSMWFDCSGAFTVDEDCFEIVGLLHGSGPGGLAAYWPYTAHEPVKGLGFILQT